MAPILRLLNVFGPFVCGAITAETVLVKLGALGAKECVGVKGDVARTVDEGDAMTFGVSARLKADVRGKFVARGEGFLGEMFAYVAG